MDDIGLPFDDLTDDPVFFGNCEFSSRVDDPDMNRSEIVVVTDVSLMTVFGKGEDPYLMALFFEAAFKIDYGRDHSVDGG